MSEEAVYVIYFMNICSNYVSNLPCMFADIDNSDIDNSDIGNFSCWSKGYSGLPVAAEREGERVALSVQDVHDCQVAERESSLLHIVFKQ